jgi:RNA polymerase sigma factor (sigma-70 family)
MTEQEQNNILNGLIIRCRKGDRLAQEELYKRYYKAMYNTSFRMLNDKIEAEDVMQESFLAAFLKINAFRGEMSFGTWLKRIVINKTIDVLRSRKMKFEELDERTYKEVEYEEGVYLADDTTILVEKIKDALKNLPEGFRVVLSLSLFEGYDHEEIAMILRISESTSRSQLARAKKKLVDYLKQHNHENFR